MSLKWRKIGKESLAMLDEAVRQNIEACFNTQAHFVEKLWTLRKDDQTVSAGQLADQLGISVGTIYDILRTLRAIEEGKIPERPSIALIVRGRIRGFLDRHEKILNHEAKDYLESLWNKCHEIARNQTKVEQEQAQHEDETAKAEEQKIPGIYVYTLPHYQKYPVRLSDDDRESNRTLLKIGKSNVDAKKRAADQNVTGLPEIPILLRIYGRDDFEKSKDKWENIEKKFHETLIKFGHFRNKRPNERGAGQEWFLTDIYALDQLAIILGLEIKHPQNVEEE